MPPSKPSTNDSIGFRCSNKDITIAVVTGSKDSPSIVHTETILLPNDYTRPEALHWLLQELRSIHQKFPASTWAIKRTEPSVKRVSWLDQRLEVEGVTQLAGAECGIPTIACKANRTIAKDLGLPGKPSALKEDLDTSVFDNFDDLPDKVQEAVLVAWSTFK